MSTISAAILSDDAAFSELLRIELKYLGADASAYSSGKEYDFFVVDLDTARIPQGFAREKCLTFSRTDPDADLARPFLISDFRGAVLAGFGTRGVPENCGQQSAPEVEKERLLITQSDAFFGGDALKLTKTELALLKLLAENCGEPVGEDVIRRTVFPGSTGNAVQVYVRYLRQKLEKFTRVRYIECLRGQGYRLLTDGLTVVIRNLKEGENG